MNYYYVWMCSSVCFGVVLFSSFLIPMFSNIEYFIGINKGWNDRNQKHTYQSSKLSQFN